MDSLIGKSFDIEQRINEVLLMMGLESVADCVVGQYKYFCFTLRIVWGVYYKSFILFLLLYILFI